MGGGQPLAHRRFVGHAPGPGHLDQAVELAPEGELVAQEAHAPLEGQGGEGHPPALARLAHHVVDGGPGAVEEDLVELRGAGQLLDGRISTPGWSMGTSR